MAIRPLAEIDRETGSQAFEQALAEKDEHDDPVVQQESDGFEDDSDIEIVEGEPEPEEKEDKVDPTSNLLGRLADLITERKAPEAPKERKARAPIVQGDITEIRKKFDAKLHEVDNPSELLDEYANALIGTALAHQNLEIQGLKKDKLKADPINAMVFEKWNDEIEDVIANLPANQQNHPDAYTYALKEVRNNHLEEIIEHKINERAAVKTTIGSNKNLGGSSGVSAAKKTKKVFATAHDRSEAKRYGLSLENYLKGIGKY